MINVAEALTYMNLIGQISLVGGNLSDFRANGGSTLWGVERKTARKCDAFL
jgi:hypothetical protein